MSRGGLILLAAGSSRRFGSDKRHHVLSDGTPLLLASLRRYASAFDEILVVLRPEDGDLADRIAAEPGTGRVRVVVCPDARLGMGHSLACGARAAVGWDWLFVGLADMAWVRDDTLITLREALARASAPAIVQPVHAGSPGHPVGFTADFLQRLGRLTGDRGARPLLREAADALQPIAVDDPGVLEDLDTPPHD